MMVALLAVLCAVLALALAAVWIAFRGFIEHSVPMMDGRDPEVLARVIRLTLSKVDDEARAAQWYQQFSRAAFEGMRDRAARRGVTLLRCAMCAEGLCGSCRRTVPEGSTVPCRCDCQRKEKGAFEDGRK